MAEPTREEVEAAAIMLLAMNEDWQDPSPKWAKCFMAWAKNQPHEGDCPKAEHQAPITCSACVYEEFIAKARAALAAAYAVRERRRNLIRDLLNDDGGSDNDQDALQRAIAAVLSDEDGAE